MNFLKGLIVGGLTAGLITVEWGLKVTVIVYASLGMLHVLIDSWQETKEGEKDDA